MRMKEKVHPACEKDPHSGGGVLVKMLDKLGWPTTLVNKHQTGKRKTWRTRSTKFRLACKMTAAGRERFRRMAAVSSAHLRDFMHATSMHGLKYAADKDASWKEKFLWLALFTAGFFTAIFFIMRMWIKWQNSPVLISVESTDYPNAQLPFPTVSICNVNQASDRAIQQMLQVSSSDGSRSIMTRADLLDLLGSLMGRRNIPGGDERIQRLESQVLMSNLTAANLTEFMNRVSQPCTQMLLFCWWQRIPVNCSKVFHRVPSNEGLCCVYNLQTVHLYGNQFNALPIETDEPVKAFGEGVSMGLSVLLNAEVHDYALSSASYYGFKVLVHHPEDQPDPATKGFAVSPGKEVFAGIRTSSIFSTEDVRKLPAKKRGCRFSDENNLHYYSRYSQSNCFMERMTKRIIRRCNCLPFYFLVGNISTPTCTSSKNACVQSAKSDYQRDSTNACPVNCNGTAYTTDVTQGTFPNMDFRTAVARYVGDDRFNDTYMQNNLALLHVFYRERSGIQYRRDTRYDWQDFVSAVGGLLGLGVGFSLLSLMEIVYFFGGLRSCLRRHRRPSTVARIQFPVRRRYPVSRLRLYY